VSTPFREQAKRSSRASERGSELGPFERVRLEREYVELDDAAADTQIRKEMAAANIRERERSQEAERLDRARWRASELETEKWERLDRRVWRYVTLAIFVVAAVSTIVMAFLTSSSGDTGIRISPGVGISACVTVVAGLLLRALNGGKNASVWEWLLQRGERGRND
jgi:hypothetical protein